MYEESLGWSIAENSIDELKKFHLEGFKSYLKRGVEIKRLDKKLLKLDLSKLAEAIDPSADLDFDYLGIQTLYDRYLVVDKTGDFLFVWKLLKSFGCGLRWVCLHTRKIRKIKLSLCTICTKADAFVPPHLRSLIPELPTHNSPPVISTRLMIQ